LDKAIFPDEKDAQAVLDAVILEFDMLTAASVLSLLLFI